MTPGVHEGHTLRGATQVTPGALSALPTGPAQSSPVCEGSVRSFGRPGVRVRPAAP